MSLKEVTEENCRQVCKELWQRLSETPETDVDRAEPFKNKVLNQLGYESCMFGCPFCKIYFTKNNCPLGDCSQGGSATCEDTLYEGWLIEIFENGRHDPKPAKVFLDYMIEEGIFGEEVTGTIYRSEGIKG